MRNHEPRSNTMLEALDKDLKLWKGFLLRAPVEERAIAEKKIKILEEAIRKEGIKTW